MDAEIARLNIDHFRKLLANEKEETKQRTLLKLIAEEELRLAAALRAKDGNKPAS